MTIADTIWNTDRLRREIEKLRDAESNPRAKRTLTEAAMVAGIVSDRLRCAEHDLVEAQPLVTTAAGGIPRTPSTHQAPGGCPRSSRR